MRRRGCPWARVLLIQLRCPAAEYNLELDTTRVRLDEPVALRGQAPPVVRHRAARAGPATSSWCPARCPGAVLTVTAALLQVGGSVAYGHDSNPAGSRHRQT